MKPRRCKVDSKWFVPRVRTQRYCSLTCKNRAAQKRLRQRAKENGK